MSKMSERYYADITAVKELDTVQQVNQHLEGGWELLKIEKVIKTEFQVNTAIQNDRIVYFVGYKKEAPSTTAEVKPAEPIAPLTAKVREALGADYSPETIHVDEQDKTVKMDYSPDRGKWMRVNAQLRALGFQWISAGKDSKWQQS